METPSASRKASVSSRPQTPMNFSKELKKALNERNLLTAKSRKKVCSMLDKINKASPIQKSEIDKRSTFRRQAIQEILDSEKAYLKQLEILMKFFIIPLKDRGIINDAIHTTLFGQIEMIYNLNGELLSELEKDLDNVAIAFLKLAPFFKLYSVYAFDYKNALFVLQDLTSKNPIFRKFLQDTETRPEVQTKLNSLMIVPIQRVPRYKLLLEQVLLYTSPADNDFKVLKESVKEVESTVSHINFVIEDQEITQTLLNLQNSLVNRSPNIVRPSRKVIKEGILDKVTRKGTQIKRYCFLMSDIFMYCKMLKDRSKDTVVENSLQCCCIFPLKKCKVYDVFPGHFKITCQGDGIILCTTDIRLGQNWMSAIKDTIELHVQCRKTLRKESSKRTPMRKKDVKYFDSDSVLRPNKRKCDYETVFRCRNNSDSDEDESSTSCFNIRNKERKRKYEETRSDIKTPRIPANRNEDTQLNLTFKVPQTPANRLTKIKHLWSDKKLNSSSKATVTSDDDGNTRSEDYDPTYGFANRFSDTKSYFRTHNVDSTIPSSVNRCDLMLPTQSTPLMDILYPLRVSGGSSKSESESESSWMNKKGLDGKEITHFEGDTSKLSVQRNRDKFESKSCWMHKKELYGNENNITHFEGDIPTLGVQSKRVKFDDLHSPMNGLLERGKTNCTKPKPFLFSQTNGSKLSLRQRIINFFSRLF